MNEQAPNDHEPTPQAGDTGGAVSNLPTDQAVLVVEDDTSAQELMRWFLPETYDVDFVSSAPAAQEALENEPYDLILMDIDLGGRRSGIDVLNGMEEEAIVATKVLAVTAYAMPGDRERLLDAGFDGYLAKPFTKDQFLRAFARLFVQDGHQPPNAET